jgi:type I restriction enzyme S subunit
VAVKEIREGFIAIHPETPRVPAEVVARLSAYLLKDGDIVFARKGGVERCAVVKLNTPMMLGSDAMRLRLSQRVVPDFIGYALQSGQHQRWMLAQASGSIMSGLNQKIIARIPLLLPPVQEQLGIVKILSSVDEPIRKGIHQAEQLQKTKQGLLQDLLTGKVRVTP